MSMPPARSRVRMNSAVPSPPGSRGDCRAVYVPVEAPAKLPVPRRLRRSPPAARCNADAQDRPVGQVERTAGGTRRRIPATRRRGSSRSRAASGRRGDPPADAGSLAAAACRTRRRAGAGASRARTGSALASPSSAGAAAALSSPAPPRPRTATPAPRAPLASSPSFLSRLARVVLVRVVVFSLISLTGRRSGWMWSRRRAGRRRPCLPARGCRRRGS